MRNIVIVGGGAGGLELATKLGKKLGKRKKANIVLIDAKPTHVWKPLLHEVATGSLDSGMDELNYSAHGLKSGYDFCLGTMSGLDREAKRVMLAPIMDESGQQVLHERAIAYDTLILAIGSVTNDFGTLGAKEHCAFLDSFKAAKQFHQRLLNKCLKVSNAEQPMPLEVAIVGAGATGVELSAELLNTAEVLSHYGILKLQDTTPNIHLIEAGPRILPALPERVSTLIQRELEKLGITVHTSTMITEVTAEGYVTKSGDVIPARLKVWAAGVKAPDFMTTLGLETNRVNQLMVNAQLRTEDEHIYALGDCACVMQEDGKPVPPRAQAAHQQASHLVRVFRSQYLGRPEPDFEYHDKGSLISLSRFNAIGNLMANDGKRSFKIEGKLARIMYVSLYRLHQVALHGRFHTLLLMLIGRINKVVRPRLKLH